MSVLKKRTSGSRLSPPFLLTDLPSIKLLHGLTYHQAPLVMMADYVPEKIAAYQLTRDNRMRTRDPLEAQG